MADQRTQIVITAKDETGQGVNSAVANIGRIGGAFTGLANPVGLAVAGITAASAAIGASIKGAIATGDQLNKLSQKTGIAVEDLSALAYAGELADVSIEALAEGIKKLSVNMAEAATNTNSKAAEAFKALNVSVKDTQGNLRASDAVLGDLADRFAAMEDGAGKTALAVALFGRAGSELIPFLNQGREGMAELRKEAERLGLVMSGETAKAAEEFNDNLKKLTLSASALGRSIAEDILPPMAKLLGLMVDAKKDGAGLFGSIAVALRSLDAEAPLDELRKRAGTLQGRISDATAPGGFNIKSRVEADRAELARLQQIIAKRLKEAEDFGPPVAPAVKRPAPSVADGAGTANKKKSRLQELIELGEKNLSASQFGFDEPTRSVGDAERQFEADLERRRLAMEKMAEQRMEMKRIETEGEEAIRESLEKTGRAMQDQTDIARDLGLTFASAFEDAVISGKKFSDVLQSLGKDIARIVLRKTVTEPLGNAVGDLFKGFDLGKIFNFSGARAGGGSVIGGDAYLIGERGPELFVPGSSGTVVPNSAMGGSNVVVNVIEAPGKGGQQQQRTEGGTSIVDVFVERIKAAIATDIADGRGSVPAALQSSYGLNRAAGAF